MFSRRSRASSILAKKSGRVLPRFHDGVEETLAVRTTGFLGVAIEARGESRPSRRTVAKGTRRGSPLVHSDGDVRRPLGCEKQHGIQVTVGFAPFVDFIGVGPG